MNICFVESTAFPEFHFWHNAAITCFFGDFAAASLVTALIPPTSAPSVPKAKVAGWLFPEISCLIMPLPPFTSCDDNPEVIAQ